VARIFTPPSGTTRFPEVCVCVCACVCVCEWVCARGEGRGTQHVHKEGGRGNQCRQVRRPHVCVCVQVVATYAYVRIVDGCLFDLSTKNALLR